MIEPTISDEFKEYLIALPQVLKKSIEGNIRDNCLAIAFNSLNDLDSVSRKSSVITDKSLFLENPHDSQKFLRVLLREQTLTDDLTYADEPYEYSDRTYFDTHDPSALDRWFSTAKAMLANERIIYIPRMYGITDRTIPSDSTFIVGGEKVDKDGFYSLIDLSKFHKATPSGSFLINDPHLIPLYNFSLPYIDRVDLGTLNDMMNDNPEKLLRLRHYLLSTILDVRGCMDSYDFEASTRKIENEVRDKVAESFDRYHNLERLHIFQTLGAVVLPWSLLVFAFLTEPGGILKVIGPGGAIASLSLAMANYLRERYEIGRSPVDLLVLIGKKAGTKV